MSSKAYYHAYYLKHKVAIRKRRLAEYRQSDVREWNRENYLAREYQMPLDEWEAKNTAQSGLCMICNQPCPTGRRLAVDHDHITGQNRDLLCSLCNRALGLFRDSVNIVHNAAAYLERWKNKG